MPKLEARKGERKAKKKMILLVRFISKFSKCGDMRCYAQKKHEKKKNKNRVRTNERTKKDAVRFASREDDWSPCYVSAYCFLPMAHTHIKEKEEERDR